MCDKYLYLFSVCICFPFVFVKGLCPGRTAGRKFTPEICDKYLYLFSVCICLYLSKAFVQGELLKGSLLQKYVISICICFLFVFVCICPGRVVGRKFTPEICDLLKYVICKE